MKKIALIVLVSALTGLCMPAQETPSNLLPQMPKEERLRQPEIREIPGFTYAYLQCKGPYAQIQAKVEEFMAMFFKQGLTPGGNFFAMYQNSPKQVKEEELQWRLGFPVAADTAPAAPLEKGEFTPTRAVVYLYVGPYEHVAYAYGKLAAFCDRNGYEPAGASVEKYLDMNPMAVKPEERKTETIWPVKKK